MEKGDSSYFLYGVFGLVFIVPVLLGLALYFLFVFPVRKFFAHTTYYKFIILGFWVGIGVIFLIGWISGFSYNTYFLEIQTRGTSILQEYTFNKKIGHIVSKIFSYTMPFSFIFGFVVLPAFFKSRQRDTIGVDRRKKDFHFFQKDFLKHRNSLKSVFLGFDKENRHPVFLADHELGMHTQVIGTTGFGKTASVLLSRLNYELRKGRGFIFLDGKGDRESFFQFLTLVKKCGRESDLLIFSPSFQNFSSKYNPLIRGNPTEIKDRLIGSQIWSEEFYKKKGEDLILMLSNVFYDLKITPTFQRLEEILKNPNAEFILKNKFINLRIKTRYEQYRDKFNKAEAKNYAGLASDISLISECDFSHLFECEKGEGIDLLDAYLNNKIIYFHLPVLAYEETAKRIGRMIIHDLKTLCAHVQVNLLPEQRKMFPVYIDEFASFASESFIELLNKARSAGIAFTLIHQSLGDIQKVSENFSRQIFENTNVKIILRIDDPQTIETYCRMIGTRLNVKMTYRTNRGPFFIRKKTGEASAKEVDEYIVDPNEFRNLKIGEGIVVVKSSNRVHRTKFDYINPDYKESMEEYLEEVIFSKKKMEFLDVGKKEKKQEDCFSQNQPKKLVGREVFL